MNKIIYSILFLLINTVAFSQDLSILKKGQNVIDKDKIKFLKLNKDFGSLESVKDNENITFIAKTIKKPENVFQLSAKLPLVDTKVKANQAMLISFEAKGIEASLETNEAKVSFIFKQTDSSSPKDVVQKSVSITPFWKTYYIPFKAIFDGNLNTTNFAMQFGYSPQKFEIKNIQLLAFPMEIDVKQLPFTKITYPGMEENASWRAEADKKIELIRKGDFELLFYLNGQPLKNVDVNIQQKTHQFMIGAAVNADDVNYSPQHLECIKKYFNTVVFENDLKMKPWKNIKKRQNTLNAIKKLQLNNINIKGHALLWPGFNYLPDVYKENQTNPKKINTLIDEHFKSILDSTKGMISHWDVLNEAYTNKDIPNIVGKEILFDVFKKAQKLDPKAKRYINEYGILSGGGTNITKQDWYFNFIKEIDQKTDGAIDGLGMQSHIGTDLTPPTKIIEVLNRFATLNKNIAISEFTLDILDDHELRAKYISDYITCAFSNKAVSEFLFWGYYEPTHPKAGLVDENFNLTKSGQAFYDLFYKKWFTKLTKTTTERGSVTERAFFGTYMFTINHNGKTYTGTFIVEKGSTNKLKINLQ